MDTETFTRLPLEEQAAMLPQMGFGPILLARLGVLYADLNVEYSRDPDERDWSEIDGLWLEVLRAIEESEA